MQRFQAPYNLKAIPEVQEYLNVAFEKSKHHGDLQDLYRRRYVVSIPYARHLLTCDLPTVVSWSNRNSLPTNLRQTICASCSAGRHDQTNLSQRLRHDFTNRPFLILMCGRYHIVYLYLAHGSPFTISDHYTSNFSQAHTTLYLFPSIFGSAVHHVCVLHHPAPPCFVSF